MLTDRLEAALSALGHRCRNLFPRAVLRDGTQYQNREGARHRQCIGIRAHTGHCVRPISGPGGSGLRSTGDDRISIGTTRAAFRLRRQRIRGAIPMTAWIGTAGTNCAFPRSKHRPGQGPNAGFTMPSARSSYRTGSTRHADDGTPAVLREGTESEC